MAMVRAMTEIDQKAEAAKPYQRADPEVLAASGLPYEQLRQVLPGAAVVLTGNPDPWTLDGTNTWVLRDSPSRAESIIVDPGPLDEEHLQAVLAVSGAVRAIILTHRHDDHTGGAKRLYELTGAPVYAVDPEHRLGSEGLGEGDAIEAAGVTVGVWFTPGHTDDSVSLLLGDPPQPQAILTGDMVLGRGTTVLGGQDNALRDYLQSMERMQRLGEVPVLPGHGQELTSIGDIAGYYLSHRLERLDQVRQARTVLGNRATARQIAEHVYSGLSDELIRGAETSTAAALAYLDTEGLTTDHRA